MAIRVSDLVFDYPDKRALYDVSFAIPENSITALVGPNGAGKTTLLRCLAALETPVSGSVHLGELAVLDSPREAHRRLGYLSDFFGLYEELTVAQCLQFVAASYKLDNAAQAIEQVVTELGLQSYYGTRAGALSRGWRQRLGIAQAIVHQPEFLLLDEPASGLDPEARHELAELLTRLRANGMTILVSSHILAELEAYSTHMLVLEQGRILGLKAIGDQTVNGEQKINARLLRIQILPGETTDSFQHCFEHPGFLLSKQTDDELFGSFTGSEQEQHRFLQGLIEAGVPIMQFHVLDRDMQNVYLDMLKQARTALPSGIAKSSGITTSSGIK
ncbi:phosphonate-transporting ATPase [Oleiphilus messinensis]|uniref:Phosphonate-transporting ATPase n=1 Tax=Oleiphilus messinensis TaxID=141451 RepID=A0A1Y0I1I2_9GAMM|nr:ABC transporter ATP-binding protein [Oleiphilus messinensis]ARU54261.1 phosphonate-transporting ATPase [Oleiphilus messinensis]